MNYNKRCDTHAGLISEKIREKEKLLILKSAMHAHTHTHTNKIRTVTRSIIESLNPDLRPNEDVQIDKSS